MKKVILHVLIFLFFSNAFSQSDGNLMVIKKEIPFTLFNENMTQLFFGYYDKDGEHFIFNGKSKSDGWIRYIWDPKTRKIINQSNVEEQFKRFDRYDVMGYQSMSPDGQYLVLDRTFKKGIVLHNLKDGISFKQDGKLNDQPFVTGVAFISSSNFYMLEQKGTMYEPQTHLLQKINISDLRVVEEYDLGLYQVDIDKSVRDFGYRLSGLVYSAFSPFNHPILAYANQSKIYILNEETKQPIRVIDLNFNGGGIVSSYARGNLYLSPLGNYLMVTKANKAGGNILNYYFQIFDIETGNAVFTKEITNKGTGVYVSDVTEEMYLMGEDKIGIYSLPDVLQGEFNYLNWLKKCDQKKDSIAHVAQNTSPKFQMKGPKNDWIYLGDEGAEGMANGIGDAIRKDGMRFIKSGLFINGELVVGKMENVYGVTMEGEFKDMKLNGFGRHVTENGTILEGEFTNGLLNGNGESIDPSGLKYVGDFKDGKYEGKGKITRPDGETFDGEFLAGKPHGNGIYMNGSQVERAEYYQGRRIDQAYQMRLEREKMEQERKLAELKEQQRQQYLAEQQKKKSSNKLLGALAMGLGASVYGSSAGMDAMQSMEFGTAMMQDVLNGGTSNLNQFGSNMNAQFAAQRASLKGQSSPEYQQKIEQKNCNLSEIYEGPDGGQGGALCAQATLMKCYGKMERLAQLCKMYKQASNEPCPVCN